MGRGLSRPRRVGVWYAQVGGASDSCATSRGDSCSCTILGGASKVCFGGGLPGGLQLQEEASHRREAGLCDMSGWQVSVCAPCCIFLLVCIRSPAAGSRGRARGSVSRCKWDRARSVGLYICLILAISLSAFVEDVTILVRGPPPHGEPRVQAMGTVSLWVKSRQQLPGVLHAVMAGGGATWATGGAVSSHLACGGGMAISAVAAVAGQRRPVSGDARCGGGRGRLW